MDGVSVGSLADLADEAGQLGGASWGFSVLDGVSVGSLACGCNYCSHFGGGLG